MDRMYALHLLKEYNKNESLLKHAYAVEAVMRHFAELAGEDQDYWGNIGLLHDLDYERYPDEHCMMTEKILKEKNVSADIIRAIMSHGYGICTDVVPAATPVKLIVVLASAAGFR